MTSGISSYLNAYKELQKNPKEHEKKLKIALLTSFTSKGIKETLTVKCDKIGVSADIYESGYNQYNQEILDPNSGLYNHDPQLIILFIDYQSLAGDMYFNPFSAAPKTRKTFIKEKAQHIQQLIETITKNTSAKVVVHNFMIPTYSPSGIVDNKDDFGAREMVQTLNASITSIFKNNNQVFIFDYESFCSDIGKNNIRDERMYYMGDIKLAHEHIPKLCDSYLQYIIPLTSLIKKCIVLDLDNTLWGGIIGEDGLEGIALGPIPQGRAFMEFQKYLLALFERGVILAVNSKNNLEDVKEVFEKHPHMILKEKHFAAICVNWNDKATNIKNIAKEINIGLDSLIFIDDDPLNRDLVSKQCPEVLVLDMPKDPALYSKTLMGIPNLSTLKITEDDRKKGEMYAQQRERKTFKTEATDLSSYLKGLGMKLVIEKANNFTIPRIAQLTQKTNQYNMTTRRYTEEQIKEMNKDHLIVSMNLSDTFGDNGTIGLAIVGKNADNWRIDTFLLSCRVIGRQVEEALLYYISRHAFQSNVKTIKAEFIPTKKNSLAKDFYGKNGFKLEKEENDIQKWTLTLDKQPDYPDFIEVTEK